MKMLRKFPTNVFRKVRVCRRSAIRQSSLFINGAKATETFVYVTPHIDFPKTIQKDAVKEQLNRRKLSYDLEKLENLWTVYGELKQRKSEYDAQKGEISRELGMLIKNDAGSQEINKYKIQINLIKDNIKKLKIPLWSAEEAAKVEFLRLPNALHSLTPDVNKILFTNLAPPSNDKNHLKQGMELDLIKFKKNENYYLTGDAAIFELGAKFYFNNVLKKNNFIQFSNPDFVKSVIVEGCGGDHTNPDAVFMLHQDEDANVNIDNRLHLTGGGSLYSFLAYHSKNVVHPKIFPLKYFAMGRQYTPSPSDEDSLFHVSQSSVVQMFCSARNAENTDTMLMEIIDMLKSAYSALGYHFRLSIVSAEKLLPWESLRVVIEMYSTSLQSYVEVANVSISGDFISKRLMLTYVENKESKFPHIISGTVLNVPKLLGCILEQDVQFSVPESLRVENWT